MLLPKKNAHPKHIGCAFYNQLSIVIHLYLDFNLNAAGEFELHQSVNGLGS